MNSTNANCIAQAFERLCATIAALRHPITGCPWDLQQTHQTLRHYMIEEAYEAAVAMAAGDPRELCDELGDVLLQVVLNAQVAQDAKTFSISDVIAAIDAKMRRRHPHVFGDPGAKQTVSAQQVQTNWQAIKASERASSSKVDGKQHYFAGTEKKHPASAQAVAIGKLAHKINFDWDHPQEVFAQVASEVEELRAELDAPVKDQAKIAAEIGDVYFSLAQLCRHLNLDPESLALDGNTKFLRRFAGLEALAKERGIAVEVATRDELESLWKDAKRAERVPLSAP